MKKLILLTGIFLLASSVLFAEQLDTSTFAYSPEFNYKNPKFEKKNSLDYFNLDYLNLAYEKWDTLNSRSNIVARNVFFDNMGEEISVTNNNFLNTNPAASHTMIVWVSNLNSNLDIFYSNFNGISWSSPQALQQSPQYEFSPDIAEFKIGNAPPAYYIVYQREGDIFLKNFYQGSFLLDTNLTVNFTEGCSSPKVRIFYDKIYIAYLKSVNSVQRIMITKANISSDYKLNNISTSEIIQERTVSGINFSNGWVDFPGSGFINYNYDTLGSVHTVGINNGNYNDKSVFTERFSGRNLNGTGSVIHIVTDNPSSNYSFSIFGWLRKSNDSSMIIAKGYFNPTSFYYSKSYYLGDSSVNSNIDVSNYFPNGNINAYRFRLVWEKKINNRISLMQCWFDDELSDLRSENSLTDNFMLEQNFPNPFNPITVIRYSFAEKSPVTLKVYNSLGNEIETLITGSRDAGSYTVTWNAKYYPSGVYYYQMEINGLKITKKMVVLK